MNDSDAFICAVAIFFVGAVIWSGFFMAAFGKEQLFADIKNLFKRRWK